MESSQNSEWCTNFDVAIDSDPGMTMELSLQRHSKSQAKIDTKPSGVALSRHATKQYKYEPVDSSGMQIRLLVIEGSEDLHATIKCRLSRVCLGTKPRYEALSYTWGGDDGDSSQTQSVLLEEKVFPVTRNLEAALYRLRNRCEARVIWIDAICIDQQNIAERNEQVQLMRKIYQQANGVILWLGEAHSRSSNAFAVFKELLKSDSLYDWYNTTTTPLAPPTRSDSDIKDDLMSVICLFIRSYWDRVWIIQEIGFANEITVVCGCDSMKWEEFKDASGRFRFTGGMSLLMRKFYKHPISTVLFALVDMGPHRVDRLEGKPGSSLGQLLARYRIAMATDPRDKVYALLGLVHNQNQRSFPIDYSLSVNELYIKTAHFLVATESDLDFLEKNDLLPPPDGLPTWVPNWQSISAETKWYTERSIPGLPQEEGMCRPVSRAAGTSTPDAYPIGTVLYAKGVVIGSILSIATPMSPTKFSTTEWPTACSVFCEWYRLFMNAGYDPIKEGPGSFYDVVSGGMAVKSAKGMNGIPNTVFVADCLLGEKEILSQHLDVSKFHPLRDAPFRTEVSSMRIWNTAVACMRRRFLVGPNFVGLAPFRAQKGDLICVVFGCGFPLVFRRKENYYEHIGDAYISGFMNGEALREGKYKLETFQIH